jgi:hypothetical protein
MPEANKGVCLPGRVVDRIRVCGVALRAPNENASPQRGPLPSDTTASAAFDTFRQWLSLAHDLSTYPTGQSTTTAFGLTVVANAVIQIGADRKKFLDVYSTSSADLFLESGVLNMMDDISAIPVMNQEQQEFGLQIVAASLVRVIVATVAKQKKVRAFHHWLHLSLRRKNFFVTERGYMRIGPTSLSEGDEVVLFSGLRTPFLVRHDQRDTKLVISVHIEGMMGGELWSESERLQDFMLT